jgi:hypothetical protein
LPAFHRMCMLLLLLLLLVVVVVGELRKSCAGCQG